MCFRTCPRHPRKHRLSVLFGTLPDDWQLTSAIGCRLSVVFTEPPEGGSLIVLHRIFALGEAVSSFTSGSCSYLLLVIFAFPADGLPAVGFVSERVSIYFSRFFFYFYSNYTPELCFCRELNLLVSSTFSPVFKKLSLYFWTIASS